MNEPRMASRERKRARAKRTSLYILGTLMLRHGRVRRFVVWDMGHEIVRRVKRKKTLSIYHRPLGLILRLPITPCEPCGYSWKAVYNRKMGEVLQKPIERGGKSDHFYYFFRWAGLGYGNFFSFISNGCTNGFPFFLIRS